MQFRESHQVAPPPAGIIFLFSFSFAASISFSLPPQVKCNFQRCSGCCFLCTTTKTLCDTKIAAINMNYRISIKTGNCATSPSLSFSLSPSPFALHKLPAKKKTRSLKALCSFVANYKISDKNCIKLPDVPPFQCVRVCVCTYLILMSILSIISLLVNTFLCGLSVGANKFACVVEKKRKGIYINALKIHFWNADCNFVCFSALATNNKHKL